MAYNTLNKLRFYKKVLEIQRKHYIPGISTYAGVWREYVNPVYPMSYDRFMDIIGISGIDTKIREEEERLSQLKKEEIIPDNQLTIFPTTQSQ